MWRERILESKKAQKITPKTISDRTGGHLPERTVSRILSGETPNPRIDTIIELGTAVGLSPQELFADTNVVAATETLAEITENINVVEAERDLILTENEMLKAKNAALTAENELLKNEIQHKDELLALHNYYKTVISGMSK
jgi:transcriptional regulator with XRE-family HTH domain